jgi:hypothetical protein
MMSKAKTEALQVRLDVLSVALVALARAVAPDRVAAVREGLWRDVALRLDGVVLSAQADEAIATDLAGLMSALGRPEAAV